MMPSTPTIRIPAQRWAPRDCPPWCTFDHDGELPGQHSHWGNGSTVNLPDDVILLVDIHADDGQPTEVVLHDSDGNTRRVSPEAALAYAAAITAAVQTALTPAVTA